MPRHKPPQHHLVIDAQGRPSLMLLLPLTRAALDAAHRRLDRAIDRATSSNQPRRGRTSNASK